MRTSPIFTFTRKVLLLGALTHLTSLALGLPQSQGTPAYTLSSTASTTSISTHLSPSLIHSSLPTPTVDNGQVERDDQGADITTETVFSTIVVPTATELTTILTVVTNAPGATTSNTPPTTITSTPQAASSPHCIVEGGSDGICVTVVPIWPTDTLAPVVKRQTQTQSQSQSQSNSETQTQTQHSISYTSTALVTSLMVVHRTTTTLQVLTATVNPTTTYTLIGPLTTGTTHNTTSSSNSTTLSTGILDSACTPTTTTTTSTSTTRHGPVTVPSGCHMFNPSPSDAIGQCP
ncbi:hypothetical protein QBC45DRAFT_6526 [Copromyces sp. CBS 386.78]|nr:hypothetical protein QBC45DRAFT_6526 [Copromyces sp. CBS 386.78]